MYRYNPGKIENLEEFKALRINLAENLEDVGTLLLVALYTSAMYPMSVSEDEVHQEITTLLDAGDWDALAFKGLQWIQELTND